MECLFDRQEKENKNEKSKTGVYYWIREAGIGTDREVNTGGLHSGSKALTLTIFCG